MRANIFNPLGMHDTSFVPNQAQAARLVDVHARKPDGSLTVLPPQPPPQLEFYAGGGGLASTGPDYLSFLRMLLHGGTLNGARVLKPETIATMLQNHIGDLNVANLMTQSADISNDVMLYPDVGQKWGLTWLINTDDNPGRRSAGSVFWAGVFNTYYWLDPKRQVTGLIMTQILPFADPIVLQLLTDFETAVYKETASHG
jgi:CubicO group peptidase (beta-lactamase class C family)